MTEEKKLVGCLEQTSRTSFLRDIDSGRWNGLRLGSFLLAVIVLFAGVLRATTVPKPGHEFPQAYVEFRTERPDLFEIKRGWRGKVDRARALRQVLLHGDRDPRKLSDAELQALTVSGTVQVPVVPVLFTPNTAPAPPSAAALDQILFTGPNPPSGTVTDYFNEVSYGLLNLTGTVFPYTTLPQADTVYEGGTNGLPTVFGSADKTGLLMQDTLNILDPGVDFSQFDNDGPDGVPNSGDDDGFVDLISFLHPERGGECATANIWAHRWIYSGWFGAAFTTDDPASGGGMIRIDDYNIQGALNCANAPLTIGTFAHETGHIFGIPDLYDTSQVSPSQGAGQWSLMASGNWNTQESPAHMSAWEKIELGWLIPTLLTATQNNVAIPQVETNATAIQVVVGNGEYFLIENRQPVGFDQFLSTCGLAIWHVDQATVEAQTQTNTVNNKEKCGAFVQSAAEHYGLALEQADGLCHLEANFNRGDAGDLFPGSTGNTSFTELTNPDSDSYASGPTAVRVTNISACGAVMMADIDAFPIDSATGPVDVVFLIDNSGSYLDDWPNIQAQMPAIVTKLTTSFPDIRFGLALFRDFPFFPFGSAGDFAYQEELPLTSNTATFLSEIATMQAPAGGSDLPESQYEAVHQLLFGLGRDLFNDGVNGNQTGEIAPSNIGWGPLRHRILYLLTDASFHDADTEDYPTGTPDMPTPVLEAEGRNAVRGQIAGLIGGGVGMTLFTLVAENPGAYVTQGEDGTVPNVPMSELIEQASELTDLTGGGVLFVGRDSADLADAIDVTLDVLNGRVGGTADLGVSKDDGVTQVIPGADLAYTITLTNDGPSTVTSATVIDAVPPELTDVVFTPSEGSYDDGTGKWTGLVLCPGESVTLTLDATVKDTAVDTVTNAVCVTPPVGVTDPNAANDCDTDVDTIEAQADLSVDKDDSQVTAVPGASVAYTITLHNNGPSTITSATLIDTLPPELTDPVFTPSVGSYDSVTGVWSNLVLGGCESVTLTLEATVVDSAVGSVVNTACVTAPAGVTDPVPGNNCHEDVNTVTPQADLEVTKDDAQTTVIPGAALAYTITVTNNGPSTVTSATLVDTLPPELTDPVFTPSVGSYDSGTGVWSNLILGAGESATLTLMATVVDSAVGSVTNTACVTAPASVIDPDGANDCDGDVDTIQAQADLGVTKDDAQTSTIPGATLVYTILLTNSGPSTVTSATVIDTLSPELTAVSFTPSAGSYDSDTGLWRGFALGAGESLTLTLVATVGDGAVGNVVNTVSVAPPAGVVDPNPANDVASDTDQIDPSGIFADGFESGDTSRWSDQQPFSMKRKGDER